MCLAPFVSQPVQYIFPSRVPCHYRTVPLTLIPLRLLPPQRRIDMLPKPLTEDICSLRGGVERLAFSCVWEMDAEANVLSTRWVDRVEYYKNI